MLIGHISGLPIEELLAATVLLCALAPGWRLVLLRRDREGE